MTLAIRWRALLREGFDRAVTAAHVSPDSSAWPAEHPNRIIAFGKAAPALADAALQRYPACPLTVVTSDAVDCSMLPGSVEVFRASHPVPDERSQQAAEHLLARASAMAAGEHLLVLASGGGSALLAAPIEGITLADKSQLNQALLASGASITEMNTVRAAVSRIKGGGLAVAAAPATVTTLVVSDVPGDDPSVVASGPTIPTSPTQRTAQDALAVLDRYQLDLPNVRDALAARRILPAVPAGDVRLVASAGQSLAAVADWLRTQAIDVVVWGDAIEGEAREVGQDHAQRALAILNECTRPLAILSGGETTVSLKSDPGRGGRNSEYALALALGLSGRAGVWALAADTDGIDGQGPHAGAFVTPDTLARMAVAGVDGSSALLTHDSASAFAAIDDLLDTGATGTNVNDFRMILIDPAFREN